MTRAQDGPGYGPGPTTPPPGSPLGPAMTSTSNRLLLAAHPTVGHTQALRAIGREWLGRGHPAVFALPRVPRLPSWLPLPPTLRVAGELSEQIERDGLACRSTPVSWRTALAAVRLASRRGYDELDMAIELFTCDLLATARSLRSRLLDERVELVATDYLFFGAWLAAEAAGVPCAVVYHSGLPFAADGAPPFGSGLEADSPLHARDEASRRLETVVHRVDERVRRVRLDLGLAPVPAGLLGRPYASALNVLTTFEAFELPRRALASEAAGPLLWAGPCLGARAANETDFPWARLAHDRPLVYVSLGTVFNDQPAVYTLLLEGVRRAGARAVVAAGASLESLRHLADEDVILVRFAPQVALLERVDAVIGHGGNNSTNETLRAGKPLLVVPFGAEQIANGQRVTALGVGAWLDPAALSAPEVARRLEEMLSTPTRSRARALAESVPEADGSRVTVDALERLTGGARIPVG